MDQFNGGGSGEHWGSYCAKRADWLDEQLSRSKNKPVYLFMHHPPFDIAKAIDESSIDQVSIEDAHRHNDLVLLEHFKKTTVILGVIAIARSRIESVDEICSRLKDALEHIDADRLIAAPDCGLGFMTREMAVSKLSALSEAARSI